MLWVSIINNMIFELMSTHIPGFPTTHANQHHSYIIIYINIYYHAMVIFMFHNHEQT